jgi:hypothetical protein
MQIVKLSSWETDSRSPAEYISFLWWIQSFIVLLTKSRQWKASSPHTFCFCEIRFNMIPLFMSMSLRWSIPLVLFLKISRNKTSIQSEWDTY